MLLQTLLNDCHKFPGFKYGKARLNETKKYLVIELFSDKRYKGKCPECHKGCPGYDHMKRRHFWFIPVWGYKVKFVYSPRRVKCDVHEVIVEEMPWAIGKRPVTKAFGLFLAHWSKKLSWKETGQAFHVSWDIVYTSVKWVVDFGLKNRCLDKIKAIGIDEVLFKRGYQFVTLVYEISEGSKRLLWIGMDRKAKTLLKFFRMLGKARYKDIKIACCDMWKPFLKVIRKKIPQAIQVLDRFHIMKKFNEAVDEVRRTESKKLAEDGKDEILKNSRWSLLKKPENLTDKQAQKLKDLTSYNLKSFKAYLLRESFQRFWNYNTVGWASNFLDSWCKMAMYSRIEPIKKVAKMLRRHKENILNWFKVSPRVSNGIVEGFNNKVKLIMRQHYGFRTFPAFEVALYHSMGKLPEPELAHSFF